MERFLWPFLEPINWFSISFMYNNKWRKSIRLFPVVVLQVQGKLPRWTSGIHHICSVTSLMGTCLSHMCTVKGLRSYKESKIIAMLSTFCCEPAYENIKLGEGMLLGQVCLNTWHTVQMLFHGPELHPFMHEQPSVPPQNRVWVKTFYFFSGKKKKSKVGNWEAMVKLTL